MALSNLSGWNDNTGVSSACGTGCGAADKPAEAPAACGSADKPAKNPLFPALNVSGRLRTLPILLLLPGRK